MFKGKTTSQLLILETQIKKKLAGGEGVDVGKWCQLSQLTESGQGFTLYHK